MNIVSSSSIYMLNATQQQSLLHIGRDLPSRDVSEVSEIARALLGPSWGNAFALAKIHNWLLYFFLLIIRCALNWKKKKKSICNKHLTM